MTGTIMKRTDIAVVNQGVDLIFDNIHEKITVDGIAERCCFSRYYYNRLFKSVTGENIYGYVKRLRLEIAAFQLIRFPHVSITRVAADLGYSSSNFAVLFKGRYGVSPSRFRQNPGLPLGHRGRSVLSRIRALQENKPETLLRDMDRRISFETIPDLKLMYRRFKGGFHELPRAWRDFCRHAAAVCPGSPLEYYGISYDDPLIVGAGNCLYDLCVRAVDSAPVRGENHRHIQKGTYLCYHFDGHVGQLSRIYNDLLSVWMPHRGFIMGPGFSFERYHAGTGPGGRLVMDLCVPVLWDKARIQKY